MNNNKSDSYGMTIFEMILAGLKTKFQGVDDAILARIASKKAEGVTDENQVDSIVEGISFSDVLTSYGDFRAGDATVKAVSNYEKKHKLKDGKPVQKQGKKEEEEEEEEEQQDKDVPAWAKAMIESNKTLMSEITSLKQEKAHATRQEQILSMAKKYGIPENYAKRCAIKDDEDLDSYFKELKQEFANDGFEGAHAPETAEAKIQKNSNELASLIDKGTEEINKNN